MLATLQVMVPVALTVHTAPSPGAASVSEKGAGAGRSSKSAVLGARDTILSPHRLCPLIK